MLWYDTFKKNFMMWHFKKKSDLTWNLRFTYEFNWTEKLGKALLDHSIIISSRKGYPRWRYKPQLQQHLMTRRRRKEAGRIRRCFCVSTALTHFRNHVSVSQSGLHGTTVNQPSPVWGSWTGHFHTSSKTKRLALFDKRKQCRGWRNGVQMRLRTGMKTTSTWRRRCSPAEVGMATWAEQETARLKAPPQILPLRMEKRQSCWKELLLS